MSTVALDVTRQLADLGAILEVGDDDLLSEYAPTATFSQDRRYRYSLTRTWAGGPTVVFVMLNPSTADAFKLDPTVTRCRGYARDWGAGSLLVLNLFALRSTDPKGLYTASDPVGGELAEAVLDLIPTGVVTVAGWGVHGALHNRGSVVARRMTGRGVDLFSLGVTKAGHPGHPLYLPGDREPATYIPQDVTL